MLRVLAFFIIIFFVIESRAESRGVDNALRELGRCDVLLKDYPVVMIPMVKRVVKQILYVSFIDYSTGEGDLFNKLISASERYSNSYGTTAEGDHDYPNHKVARALDELSGADVSVVKSFLYGDRALSDREVERIMSVVRADPKSSDYWYCELVSAHAGVGEYADAYKDILQFVGARPVEGRAGDFDVKINSCFSRTSLGLRNKNHEPERLEGSRFYVVNVSLENLGRTTRQPGTGRLLVYKDGVEYVYDSAVRVFADGYNFGYSKLGPLLKVRTNIAYRIPDNLDGEVFWSPGGSSRDDRFWCGNIHSI